MDFFVTDPCKHHMITIFEMFLNDNENDDVKSNISV